MKPDTATHYLAAPNGQPQAWYRITKVQLNTGEIIPFWEYYSSFGIWIGTNYEYDQLIPRLVKIEETKL